MGKQPRPLIGVNPDLVASGKQSGAAIRLPLGYLDAITAAGFRTTVISEPPIAPDTPRELLPPSVADRQWIPCFLFFVLRAT